jgi:sugar O-acyltransferase (sialic acid O-acetyltransferase NeuD family)
MSENISCVILGAGGHARVLIECLGFDSNVVIAGILAPLPHLKGESICDIPVLGNDDLLGELHQRGVRHFVVGVGGTGDNRPRKKLFEIALNCSLAALTVKHPTAIISASAAHGEGCQFLPGCIVNANAVLGSNIIINSGAIIEHDCIIGDHVHVATGARLSGAVRVETGAHIGVGATIRQGIVIGEFSIVGAGAVVVKDVPPNLTVMGVPAKIYTDKSTRK